jgi:hypothetical protein
MTRIRIPRPNFILKDFFKVMHHQIKVEFVDEGRSGKDPNRPEFQ